MIRQPFWFRPWFLFLAFLGALGLVWMGLSWFSHLRYARLLQSEVHERTQALRDLQQETDDERRKLATVLAGISDGVTATDGDGRIVLWNAAAEEITGIPEEQALGRGIDDLLPRRQQPTSDDAGPIEPGSGPIRVRGESREIEFSVASIGLTTDDRPGKVYAFRDVTDQRRMETELAQGRRLEALGVLAGGIAHDFNNLLMVLIGNLSMIELDGNPGPDDRENLQHARTAALRSRSLAQQLLTFARGGAPVVQASSIVEWLRESTSFALRGTSATIEIDIAGDLPVVEIDVAQMSQVIQNLLINARQAMQDRGWVRVRATSVAEHHPVLGEGRYVKIEIEDDGVGIPAEDLEKVFDPYFSTKKGGSGLGLATAYSIVNRHHGHLSIESAPGAGARFCIWLPVSSEAVEVEPPAAEPSPRGVVTGRILVMDDEENVRKVIRGILEKQGYTTVGASDGAEAIRLYQAAMEQAQPFDAVVLDLTVQGGMGGQDTLVAIHAIDDDVRAIAVSGYSNDPVLANHAQYGFRAGLGKPFPMEELTRVVAGVLER